MRRDRVVEPDGFSSHFDWAEGLKEVRDWEGRGLGSTVQFNFEAFGKIQEARAVCLDYESPNRIVWKVWAGDMSGTETWLFMPHPQGTKVTVVIDISVQGIPQVLTLIAHRKINQTFQDLIDGNLERMKAAMEKMP